METPNTPRQTKSGPTESGFNTALEGLPLATYRAGDPVLIAGSKSGRLLILKSGAVVILKGPIEIATVNEPGAVFGEISALLDHPHTADVRALEDSEFYVADGTLVENDPIALLHVARILARRLVAADERLVGLRNQLHRDQSAHALSELVAAIEGTLNVTQPFRGRFLGRASAE